MNFFFYLSPQTHVPSDEVYEHGCIAIAEGLQILGYTFFANTEQWFDQSKKEFLFKKAPSDYNPDICIYSASYLISNPRALQELNKRKYNILIDLCDGITSFSNQSNTRVFNIILRTHFNNEIRYNKNTHPWAFGLTNRIIDEINKSISDNVREEVYVNYRVNSFNTRELSITDMLPVLSKKYKINHSTTDLLEIKDIPGLDKFDYWKQTGRRHNASYFKQLNHSLITLSFCGAFIYKSPVLFYRLKEKLEKTSGMRLGRNFLIVNFDSWRFWETLLSNSCPIHIDFEFWNLIFPVMPASGVHYIGVRNMNFEETAYTINSLKTDEIKKISADGREFVLQNYSPEATARRVINLINYHN